MPSQKTIGFTLTLILCLILSACKVVYTTPEASSEGEKSASVSSLGTTSPPYSVQSGTPAYIANLSALGCTWQGVAGQVFNDNGETVNGLTVKVGGKLNGTTFSSEAITGTTATYGAGGFEVDLVSSGSPIASQKTLWIQLYNSSGAAVSDKYYFNTYADCAKNLVIINFADLGPIQLYFPVIYR